MMPGKLGISDGPFTMAVVAQEFRLVVFPFDLEHKVEMAVQTDGG
jgi:hypothetical protein